MVSTASSRFSGTRMRREGERCRAEAEEDDRRQKERAPTDAIGRSAAEKAADHGADARGK